MRARACLHAPVRLGKVVLHLSVNAEPTHPVHTNDGLKHIVRKILSRCHLKMTSTAPNQHTIPPYACGIAPANTLTYIMATKGRMWSAAILT